MNEELKNCKGFQWDSGNFDKNWKKHKVNWFECEQIFFNSPLIIASDESHSLTEHRYYALGQTNLQRQLFIVFTKRDDLIRIISARDMNKSEREIYAKNKE